MFPQIGPCENELMTEDLKYVPCRGVVVFEHQRVTARCDVCGAYQGYYTVTFHNVIFAR